MPVLAIWSEGGALVCMLHGSNISVCHGIYNAPTLKMAQAEVIQLPISVVSIWSEGGALVCMLHGSNTSV